MVAEVDTGGTITGDQLARIDSWVRASAELPLDRLRSEGLGLLADLTGADRVSLLVADGVSATPLAAHPLDLRTDTEARACPVEWLPWGLGGVQTQQFIFVPDARALPATPGGTERLGDRGVRSAAHLPIVEHGRLIGAVSIWWADALTSWNDAAGPVLRNLARLLLVRSANRPTDPTQPAG